MDYQHDIISTTSAQHHQSQPTKKSTKKFGENSASTLFTLRCIVALHGRYDRSHVHSLSCP